MPHWLAQLRRAGIDYAACDLPGSDHKVDHAVELGFTRWHRPSRPRARPGACGGSPPG